jgi:midasin
MMQQVGAMLAAEQRTARASSALPAQLLFIIGDGRNVCAEGRTEVVAALSSLISAGVFVVYVALDDRRQRLVELTSVEMTREGGVVTRPYMHTFPFPFYVLLQSATHLPAVVGDALRQWMAHVADANTY